MLCSTLILALLNFETGVLSTREKKGREHVIAYARTRPKKKLRQKSVIKCELSAIYAMVRRFKHVLVARQVIVRTDYQVLTW